MKRENCEFGMNHTSEIGNLAKNNSYFDFVELDKYSCWVAADETTGDDKQIAIMVVHSILKSFRQKPTMSQRELNKYISEARELVVQIKGNRRMNVGLAVVITDYTKAVCIASGNEKIFLFKSMSSMNSEQTIELSANDSDEKDFWIDPSEEDFVFGSLIWKMVKLQDGDVLLLCNAGFWKKVDQYEITNALHGVKEPYMFLYNLKYLLYGKQDPSLVSYTIAAIFAFQVAKPGASRWMKPLAAVVAVLLLLFGIWHYQLLNRFKPASQEEQQASVDNTKQEETIPQTSPASKQAREAIPPPNQQYAEAAQKGDQYVKAQEYVKALEEYNKAVNAVLSGDKTTKSVYRRKADLTQLIIDGDKLAASGASEAALAKYMSAQQKVMEKKDYDTTGLQKRITTTQGILDVKKGIAQGDRELILKNYQVALDEYTRASELAREIAYDTRKLGLEKKIKKAENQLQQEAAEAERLADREKNLENEKLNLKTAPSLKPETTKPLLSKEPSHQPAKSSGNTSSRWAVFDYNARVEPPTGFMEGNNKFLMADFCAVKNGALVMNTMDNPAAGPSYKLAIPSDRTIGFKFTVVARVKVDSEYGMDFDLRAVGLRERIRLLNSGIKLENTGNRSGFIKTADWHTYWITFEVVDAAGTPTLLTKVYVDGASTPVVKSESTTADSNNYFRIGDCSGSNGYSGEIDWIVWKFNETGKPGQMTLPTGFTFK